MEIWDRLKGAIDRANTFDDSTFCKDFQPELLKYIENKDTELAKIIIELEALIAKIEEFSDTFYALEQENEHGIIPLSWFPITSIELVE